MSYKQIIDSDNYTVLSEYEYHKQTDTSYQSEKMMEDELIEDLCAQGYEYLPIKSESDLICNLRKQIGMLNKTSFSDAEWDRFFNTVIKKKNASIISKAEMIQEAYTAQDLLRDNESHQNIILIDKQNIHNNRLQIINQYEVDSGSRKNRYDVTILVNGLPMVHVELKRRGVSIREAFNQIKRYQNDSFWAGCGLFEFVQLFVISNGTETKYYSNTTRYYHATSTANRLLAKSDLFQFTSYWSTAKNELLLDIKDFTRTFFAKATLLNILTKYCVFTTESKLLAMRPYQIAATERVLQQINIAYHNKLYGTVDAGGYVWHTTGSGKTLTSFKTAQLASKIDYIHKVIFVVDRKDLDYQTIKEYEKFEKGCVDGNRSTAVLQNQLENKDRNGNYKEHKIIVTTIQKLSRFIGSNAKHEIYDKHVVFIFDECHRSQFGDMHKAIVDKFKNYYMFGFTGTPIMSVNAAAGNKLVKTTAQAFGKELHIYTIVNAINDKNVLPFRVEYVNTMKEKESIRDTAVTGIDIRSAIDAPDRIRNNVRYILEHFDQQTKRNKAYSIGEKRLRGFNSIFAVESIPMARQYYAEFKRQQANVTDPLRVALIYTYTANEETNDGVDAEALDPSLLDETSRSFLDAAIKDYCNIFNMSNLDTSSSGFDSYYKDVSKRMKNKELDILIVVNMFLTGFDAPTLNTLWIDKPVRMHGLLQAFSRTNRILNDAKTHGNIVCFRDLTTETHDAIALFGGSKDPGVIMVKSFNDLFYGYEEKGRRIPGYVDLVNSLRSDFPLSNLRQVLGECEKLAFIKLFSNILRLNNMLDAFSQFDQNRLFEEREYSDYLSFYLDLKDETAKTQANMAADIQNDVEFETELIEWEEINVDYILATIEEMSSEQKQSNIREINDVISRILSTSPKLRSKRELIRDFINTFNVADSKYLDEKFEEYVRAKFVVDLDRIIEDLGLDKANTVRLMANSFESGNLITSGEQFDSIVKTSLFFAPTVDERANKLMFAREALEKLFEIYGGLYVTAV